MYTPFKKGLKDGEAKAEKFGPEQYKTMRQDRTQVNLAGGRKNKSAILFLIVSLGLPAAQCQTVETKSPVPNSSRSQQGGSAEQQKQPSEKADFFRPDPADMASPYVVTDSWIYPALERLAALGYIENAFLGQRPWTRMQCAALLREAKDNNAAAPDEDPVVQDIYNALATEFALESGRLDGAHNLGVRLESMYARVTGISGQPLTNGFEAGQTIINDYGRRYGEGGNVYSGITTDAVAGPFTFYVRGEYQHSSFIPALPLSFRQAIAQRDSLPLSPAIAYLATDRFRLLDAYAGVIVRNWQLSFGRQTLWWGPDQGTSLMFSSNAEPMNMLRIDRVAPINLPSILKWLGPMRMQAFVGRLAGYEFILNPSGLSGAWGRPLRDQPFIHGEKISFKPTPNFEFGFFRDTIFAGTGYPFTLRSFARSLFSLGNTVAGAPNKPGDRDSGFDFSYRLPKLRKWLTFYAEGYSDDEFSPVAYWDRSQWYAGLYMPRVPRLSKLDLRVEGGYTDVPLPQYDHGANYFDATYRSGHTNQGNLLGSWMGRQGQGAEGWATYHLTARNFIQVYVRHQKVSQHFIPSGGTITDGALNSDFLIRPTLGLSTSLQYEKWTYPVLSTVPRTPFTVTVQLTYWPRVGVHSKE
jgi:hypothetical protein